MYKNGWTDPDAVSVLDSGGPKEPCIRWRSRSPQANGAILWAKWAGPGHVWRSIYSKLLSRAVPVLGGCRWGMHIGVTWRIRLNRPCAAAMRLYIKLLWPLVLSSFSNAVTLLFFGLKIVTTSGLYKDLPQSSQGDLAWPEVLKKASEGITNCVCACLNNLASTLFYFVCLFSIHFGVQSLSFFLHVLLSVSACFISQNTFVCF